MNTLIAIKKQKLFTELSNSLRRLFKQIFEYMQTFETESFFTFSAQKQEEQLKREYNSFIFKTSSILSETSTSVANISSLLIDADKEMDNESAASLKEAFDGYVLFEKAFTEYKRDIDIMFSRGSVSVSRLLDGAKKLTLYINSILDKIQ